MAVSYCSPLGAVPCQEAWFSIKLTPLPFTVLAMMAVGLAMVIGLWDLWMAWLRQWVSQFGTLL